MLIEQVIMILKKLRIKCLKDEMHWPPQPSDLEPEKFNRHSVAQDIVYIATNGRVKTPKSLLLPGVIKMLTNNTEVINILNSLVHGVSHSILSEMLTSFKSNCQMKLHCQ